MDKYVYCHDSGSYESVTSLKGSESRVFETLREVTSPGTFLYAPTTEGKAILFSYTQANGQFRIDGYKGDFGEFGTNPATYIGNVRVSPPYYEKMLGALPCTRIFSNTPLDKGKMVHLIHSLIYGSENEMIVLLGSDITARASEYLKFLFLLLPPPYARKVGFCLNKYIKGALADEDRFSEGDEKPVIRIYALDSENEFAGCDKIKLDSNEPPLAASDIGAKALSYLVGLGISQERFAALSRVLERAFLGDTVDKDIFTRCLVGAAFEEARLPEYATALVGYGFSDESERATFIDAVNFCLESGDKDQKRIAADKALKLLKNDLSPVSDVLLSYLFTQETVTGSARDFMVRTVVSELEAEDAEAIGDDDLLRRYLYDEAAPSWRQKYEFTVALVSRLVSDGKRKAAHGVCRVLSDRFRKENLIYAKNFSRDALFELDGMDGETQCAVYAALLKNDCDSKKIHEYARIYLKKHPSFDEIFNVYNEIKEIFGVDFSECDFIFADTECKNAIGAMIKRIGFAKLLENYRALSAKLDDFGKFKAQFLAELLNAEKLRSADQTLLDTYEGFMNDAEAEIEQLGGVIGDEETHRLEAARKECKAFLGEKSSAMSAQEKIDEFCGSYLQKLYEMLPVRQREEVKKTSVFEEESGQRVREPFDRKKVAEKYSNNNFKIRSGQRAFNFGLLFALLAGMIVILIMFIPAVYLASSVGELTLASFFTYLSRYNYAVIGAVVVTLLVYTALYFSVAKRRGKAAFGITALCTFIPCCLYAAGYILTYIFLT